MELTNLFSASLAQNLSKRCKVLLHRALLQLSCCELCNQPCQHYYLLCDHCLHDMPNFYYQRLAGDLLNWPALNQHLPGVHFDRLLALSPYLWPFKQWISQLKYQSRFELAKLFAQLLHRLISETLSEYPLALEAVVVPVPIHPQRYRQRGYNQAHLIARALAHELGLPYQCQLIEKIRDHGTQVGQSGAARRKSLANTFAINPQIAMPKQLILVDDVVTTGSTASQISKLCKQHGTQSVTVLAVALTLPSLA